MRVFTFMVLLFCALGALADDPPVARISLRAQQMPFDEFRELVWQQTQQRLYSHAQWTANWRIDLQADSLPLATALARICGPTNMRASVWNGHWVLLPGQVLIDRLPTFDHPQEMVDQVAADLQTDQPRYLSGRRADTKQVFVIGSPNVALKNKAVSVRGRIVDAENAQPIVGATLFIEERKTGTITDADGLFSIDLKPGKYHVLVNFLGMRQRKLQWVVNSPGKVDLELEKDNLTIDEVTVYGDRQSKVKSKDPGLEKIQMKAIRQLPTMAGERDILRISETLPGIVSVGEGSAGLNVRGGNADQNAFYLNRIPIYNTAHLFGFFPAFNSDIIQDFTIHKGHIPAKYGGRLSSVFSIDTKTGNPKRFMARGGITPMAANAVLEFPIVPQKVSVAASARGSYANWLLQRIEDPDIRNSRTDFYDFSAKVHYEGKRNQLSVFAYQSHDRFKLADVNDYTYANQGLAVEWRHQFRDNLHADFSLVRSAYSFATDDKQDAAAAYHHGYQLQHYEGRADWRYNPNEKLSIDFGATATHYRLARGWVQPIDAQSLRSAVNMGSEYGLEAATYLGAGWQPNSWLSVSAGLRYTLFAALGPQAVLRYHSGAAYEARTVRDTLMVASAAPVATYHQPDVRLSARLNTDQYGSVKLAYNTTHQNVFMLNNTVAVSPNAQWKLADYHLQPAASNQWSAGVFRELPKWRVEASAELFYKTTAHYTEFRDGADFLNPYTERAVLQGNQQAYGVELLLKKAGGRINGWVSYTYSRSWVQVDGGSPWSQINNGKTYPSNFDIPHAVSTVLNWNISRRVILSSLLSYQTGKPATFPESVYYIDGVPYTAYSERNAYRIPDYFRADLSLTIEGSLRRQKWVHSSWMISAYNLTGRRNAYSVFFNNELGQINSYQYSVIGVPVFSVSWLFKLGNYATE